MSMASELSRRALAEHRARVAATHEGVNLDTVTTLLFHLAHHHEAHSGRYFQRDTPVGLCALHEQLHAEPEQFS